MHLAYESKNINITRNVEHLTLSERGIYAFLNYLRAHIALTRFNKSLLYLFKIVLVYSLLLNFQKATIVLYNYVLYCY